MMDEESVESNLSADLDDTFSSHPAAKTLSSVARVLATVLDSPSVRNDGRVASVVSKELREVLRELTGAKEAEHDDIFDGGGPEFTP